MDHGPDRRRKRKRQRRRGAPAPAAGQHTAQNREGIKSPTPFARQLLVAADTAKEGAQDPHLLAREVLKVCGMYGAEAAWRYWGGQVYRWQDARYTPMSDDLVKSLLTGTLKDHFDRRVRERRDQRAVSVTPALVNKVANALASMLLVESDDIPVWLGEVSPGGEIFAFHNGLLRVDVESGSALSFDPPDARWFSRVRFPYRYDETADCARWLAFVSRVLPEPEDRRLLQEIFGYCLIPDTRLQKFFLFEGRGSNGKSVTTNVLTELLGADNVSSVALEEFGDAFGLETTIGKLANIVSEINDPSKLPEGIIKKVVGGERITINRKHLKAVQVKPSARLVVTTNEVPQFRDQSNGMSRRLVPLRFRVCIPEHEQDPHLLDALTVELPGIFLWALEGLKRLRRRGQFELTDSSRAMLEEMRPDLPSSRQFLQMCCEQAPGAWTSTDALYAAYESWCVDMDLRPEARSKFCQKIGWDFPEATQQREGSGDRRYGYAGISLRGGTQATTAA